MEKYTFCVYFEGNSYADDTFLVRISYFIEKVGIFTMNIKITRIFEEFYERVNAK